MKANGGGQAFPSVASEEMMLITHSGLSKREWYAGMALQGDWASQSDETGEFYTAIADAALQSRAALYLRMADAMILESEKEAE